MIKFQHGQPFPVAFGPSFFHALWLVNLVAQQKMNELTYGVRTGAAFRSS
jgi:hypothetical protein